MSGKRFNLIVAFTRMGAPSFADDPEGTAIGGDPWLLDDVKAYVRNATAWLARVAG